MIKIDDAYLDRLAEIESGRNTYARNPKSSAGGLFQFVDATADRYGLKGDDRFKPEKAIPAARAFTDDNARELKAGLGRDPSQGELYLAHQQGAGGALKLLQNPDARAVDTLGADQVKLNGGTDDMTNAQFAQKWISKFEGGNVQKQTDDLTPEEENELAALEAEFGQQDQGEDLSPEEEEELAALEAEFSEEQQPKTVNQGQGYIGEKKGIKDFARTALDQGMQGATFGFADEITDRAGALIASLVTGQKYGDLLKEARTTTKARLDEQMQEMPATSIAANIGGALLTGGAGTSTKAGAAAANSLRTGSTAARVVKGAAAGATSGAAYGAGTAEDGKRIEGAGKGAAVGATVGAAVPAVAAAGRAVKNAVIPKVDEALKPLAKRAQEFGIPLRGDQITKSRVRNTLQKVTQEIPGSGADAFEETQRAAITKAVARTIGQESDDLGPETIGNFLNEASAKFNDHLKGETIKFGRETLKKFDDLIIDAEKTIDNNLANIVRKNIDDVRANIDSGEIVGEKLASVRSELLKRSSRASGGAREFLSDAIGIIDDAVEGSLSKAKGNSLKQVRREWRNFKTIEPLLEESTDGQIDPVKLMNRVKSSKYIKASRAKIGDDDLVDIARIGKQFLPKKGGSDTVQKAAALGALAAPGSLYGAVTGDSAGDKLQKAFLYGVGPIALARGYQGYNTNKTIIDMAMREGSKKLPRMPINPLIAASSANQ